MFPAISVATVFLIPSLWILLIAAEAVWLLGLVFGFLDVTPYFQRAAFAISGVVTVLGGGGFHYLIYLWAKHIEDLQRCIVLTAMGILAIAVPFLPDTWLGGSDEEERLHTGFRFLLGFAAIGFALALVFTLSPPYAFQSIREAVLWLCPAGVLGMLSRKSFAAVTFTALLNAAFFAAVGGVIGMVLGRVMSFKCKSA